MAAAFALVGKGTSGSNSVTTASGTSAGGSGTAFVIVVSFDAGVTISTVSDSKSNTYSIIGSVQTISGTKLAFYECLNGTGGASHTATVSFSGTAYPVAHLINVTGIASSSARDVNVTAGPYGTNADIASGTLAQANEVILVGMGAPGSGTVNYSESSAYGFTQISEEQDGNNYWTSAVFGLVTSSTASKATQWTIGSAIDWNLRLISYKEATGGGSYSLAMGQGSYALSGQTVALKASRKVAAAQGSYALTGQAATLTYSGSGPKTLTAAQGSYALSGQAAGLKFGRVLAAASGSYTITGSDVLADYAITAAAGSYSLSGQAVGLRASRKLAAAQGSYALTGQAAALRAARKIAAAQGAYSFTGNAAALDYSGSGAKTITADRGTYTLSGQSTTLRLARRLTAVQGSYALSGQSAGLLFGRKLAATQGGYSLAGQSVTLTYAPASRVLTAVQGVYTITGFDVQLTASMSGVFEDEPRSRFVAPGASRRIGLHIGVVEDRRIGGRNA